MTLLFRNNEEYRLIISIELSSLQNYAQIIMVLIQVSNKYGLSHTTPKKTNTNSKEDYY